LGNGSGGDGGAEFGAHGGREVGEGEVEVRREGVFGLLPEETGAGANFEEVALCGEVVANHSRTMVGTWCSNRRWQDLYLASSIKTSKIWILKEFTAVNIFKYPNCFVPGDQGNIHSSENIKGSNARTFPPTRYIHHQRGGIKTPRFDSNP
jgi:hypothetical protein